MRATPVLRVVEREASVFRHLWRGSVFSSVLTPVLFLAAMGVGLGGLIDQRSGGAGGVSYVEFIAPGLLAAKCLTHSAANCTPGADLRP